MPLYLVDAALANASGGVCLDGSPPAYYYTPSPDGDTSRWLLYFKGGGWCYDEPECASRARGDLGSSKHLPPKFAFSGIMDSDPKVSPTFAHFNRVLLWYCDGASFAGDRTEPVHHKATNQSLYFRGRRVLDIMLQTLATRHRLNDATEVLLGGGSAGGLATYLHADYVHTKLRALGASSLAKYKAAPVSGFFPMHDDARGAAAYPDDMRSVFKTHNCTGGVHPACVAALPSSEAWRCIFANYSYAYTETPMFPLQSALDFWQLQFIWGGDHSCVFSNYSFTNCTRGQIADLNSYAASLLADYTRTAKFGRDGEGGFVEPCLEHVKAQSGAAFNRFAIDNVTEQQALSAWWHASPSAPAQWYLPCRLSDRAPHECNPSCAAGG